MINHLFKAFVMSLLFLQNGDLPPSAKKLLDMFNDQPTMRKMQIKIAITIDAMEAFVKATYNLEGDGALTLSAYEEIHKLFAVVRLNTIPMSLLLRNSFLSSYENQQVTYGCNCAQPAFDYFKLKFSTDLKPVVDAFRAARYFSPSKLSELKPTVTDIDQFSHFPFLKPKIPMLKAELPSVIAACEEVHPSVDPINGGNHTEKNLQPGMNPLSWFTCTALICCCRTCILNPG